MARGRSGSRSRFSSSPRRSAPPPATQPARPAAHQQQTTAHPQQPQVTNIYVQRGAGGMGGGMGSGMFGTMAAVAGGSVLGHGISNYLYGQNNQAPTQPAEAQQLAQAAANENYVCTPQLVGYSKCLESNPDNAENCKWAWDYFQQCQQKSPMVPPS